MKANCNNARGAIERNAQLILDRLTHIAPMSLTMVELVEETGLSRPQLNRALPTLRTPENRKVRIAGWDRQRGKGGDVIPKYAIGSGPDARKISGLSDQQYSARQWKIHGPRWNLMRRAKRGARATPFDGLMQ
jgi:hypothetical protein